MIPSAIHQNWLSGPIDPRAVNYMEKAKIMAESYHLWTDKNVWTEMGQSRPEFAAHWNLDERNSVALGDVLRVLLIHRHGGFYLDSDVELFQPVATYRDYDFVVTTNCRTSARVKECHVVSACYGAAAQSPVLSAAICEMEIRKRTNRHWTSRVGFLMLRDVMARFRGDKILFLNKTKSELFQHHHEHGAWHKDFGA